jgi:hypothetical protein
VNEQQPTNPEPCGKYLHRHSLLGAGNRIIGGIIAAKIPPLNFSGTWQPIRRSQAARQSGIAVIAVSETDSHRLVVNGSKYGDSDYIWRHRSSPRNFHPSAASSNFDRGSASYLPVLRARLWLTKRFH